MYRPRDTVPPAPCPWRTRPAEIDTPHPNHHRARRGRTPPHASVATPTLKARSFFFSSLSPLPIESELEIQKYTSAYNYNSCRHFKRFEVNCFPISYRHLREVPNGLVNDSLSLRYRRFEPLWLKLASFIYKFPFYIQ